MRFFLRLARSRAFLAAGVVAAGLAGTAQAQPSLLFDVGSGAVLEHQEAFRRWHPASLTKLMTAYTTFRAVEAGELTLKSPIRMTRHAAAMPPAKMGFRAGSVLTLDNALKSIMVKSANDVAMAIGENVGGSEKAFAARMNKEAARLGMTGSHWVNPNGLHDPGQYTTARDLALLVRAIRTEFPQYAPYFSIDGIVVGKKVIKTFNTLMGRYPGADGMKTGFVCASGFNLIGTATRGDRLLAAIVLGESSPDTRAAHAAALLTAGFEPPTPRPAAAGAPAQAPAPVTLDTLQPYGGNRDQPTDMHEVVCGAKPKSEQSEASQQPETPEPEVVENLAYRPRLEVVALGGADGPVPRAMLDVSGQIKADVPLPPWRPDKPLPPGAEPVARLDAAADGAQAGAQAGDGGAPVRAAVPDAGATGREDEPAGALDFGEPLQERFGGPVPLRPSKSPS